MNKTSEDEMGEDEIRDWVRLYYDTPEDKRWHFLTLMKSLALYSRVRRPVLVISAALVVSAVFVAPLDMGGALALTLVGGAGLIANIHFWVSATIIDFVISIWERVR